MRVQKEMLARDVGDWLGEGMEVCEGTCLTLIHGHLRKRRRRVRAHGILHQPMNDERDSKVAANLARKKLRFTRVAEIKRVRVQTGWTSSTPDSQLRG